MSQTDRSAEHQRAIKYIRGQLAHVDGKHDISPSAVRSLLEAYDIALEDAHETQPDTSAAGELTIEVENYQTDCGRPCTPNGCMGHTTDIPEIVAINGFSLTIQGDFEDWLYEASRNGDLEKWRETVATLAALREQLEQAQAALNQKDDKAEELHRHYAGVMSWAKAVDARFWADNGPYWEKLIATPCESVRAILAIQPDSSALKAVIEAETAKLREALEAAENALRLLCIHHLNFDPSDGEGTTPDEVVDMLDTRIAELLRVIEFARPYCEVHNPELFASALAASAQPETSPTAATLSTLTEDVERLRLRSEIFEEAYNRAYKATYQSHSGHWDRTGQRGANCPECNRATEARKECQDIIANGLRKLSEHAASAQKAGQP